MKNCSFCKWFGLNSCLLLTTWTLSVINNSVIYEAMDTCIVRNEDCYLGETLVFRLANNIFDDKFDICVYKTFWYLDTYFKAYSKLNQLQGQIFCLTFTNNNIQVFIQWVYNEYHFGRKPNTVPLTIKYSEFLLCCYNTHYQFENRSNTLVESAKPGKFTINIKWEGWIP